MNDPEQVGALEAARNANSAAERWSALAPLADRRGQDREVAEVWAEALRLDPRRSRSRPEAEALLEQWPGEPAIVLAAGYALVGADEHRPIDEPPLSAGGAAVAAGAARRCLARLSAEVPVELRARLHALRGNALRLLGPKRFDDAHAALSKATELVPDQSRFHFDLGLLLKQRRDFAGALDANQRAQEHAGRDAHLARIARWNIAVCATALGRAAEATQAWRGLGFEVLTREGSFPRVEGLPPVRVRLSTLGSGHGMDWLPEHAAGFESVWAQPLSPCHGVVRSPTFRDAAADFGDVLLWDGAPVAITRSDNGEVTPHFPMLALLKEGGERRYRFVARRSRAGAELAFEMARQSGLAWYPLGEKLQMVCPRCATDRALPHRHELEEQRLVFGKVVAEADMTPEAIVAAVESFKRANPETAFAVPGPYEDAGRTAEAGRQHKRWGALTRGSTQT